MMTAGEPEEVSRMTRKQRIMLSVVTALAVAVAFQWILMARGGYDRWRPEVIAIEVGVALLGAFVGSIFDDLDTRGAVWAEQYVPSRTGLLYHILTILPSVAARAALITACLSIPNATVVPTLIYREEVGFAPVAVLVRFLADIPQALLICLVVRLALEWWWARQQEKQQAR